MRGLHSTDPLPQWIESAPYWEKHSATIRTMFAPVTGALIGDAGITEGQSVLDVATVAVPLALPTFFEIPLALILLASGAPMGAAVALLIAGPSINLPSLFTIMRSTNWKVAAVAAVSIWALAVSAGVLVSLF